MTIALSASTFAKVRQPNRADPMLEFWRITVEQSEIASPTIPIASVNQPTVLDGVTYWPFPFRRRAIQTDSDGSVKTMQLTLSNVSRIWARLLHERKLLEMPAVLDAVLASEVDSNLLVYRSEWTIESAAVDSERVTLELATGGLEDTIAPIDRYHRGGCRWRYRGAECGYDGDLPTCRKDVADCIAHGDDEFARGLPRAHPQQFGGHPGILRRVI